VVDQPGYRYYHLVKGLKHHLPTLSLFAALATIFALRWVTVRQHIDMGQDIANYLGTMNTVFGEGVRGIGLDRPPLIALPLKLFTLAFGDLNGVKVLGVLVSVGIGVPFYLLAKRLCRPWIAVAVTILFVATPAYADMLSWGYITMFAIFFILFTLHFFLLLLEKPSKANIFLTGLFASFVVGSHQLSLVFFLSLFVIFIVALLLFNRKALLENYKPVGMAIAVGFILSLPYLPIYLHLLHIQAVGGSDLSTSAAHWSAIKEGLGGLASSTVVILLAAIALIIALVWLWRRDRNYGLLLAVMLLLSAALLSSSLPPPLVELNRRAQYYIYIPTWLLVGFLLSRLWSWQEPRLRRLSRQLPKLIVIVFLASLLPWEVYFCQNSLSKALDYHGYLDDTRWQVVRWIGENINSNTTTVVYPMQLGWWIEAEAKRKALYLVDRNMSPTTLEREGSLVADRILSRNQGWENGNLRLATTYPYNNAPGTPVLSVYVGGFYQDVLLFDEQQSYFDVGTGNNTALAAILKGMVWKMDDDLAQVTTSYQTDDLQFTQTMTLKRGEHEAEIYYQVNSSNTEVTKFDIPVFFSQPASVQLTGRASFEVTEDFNTSFQGVVPVTATVTIEADGATVDQINPAEQKVECSFSNIEDGATISFHISITSPQLKQSPPLTYYDVPELIKEHGINYIVVDLTPPLHNSNDVPQATEEWLDNCPYYKLIYSDGDIRVYQVQASAPP
jgi:hypothetical protein